MKKNKIFKLTGIMLCLAIFLCVCVASASAASTINFVEITYMDMPEEGMAPDYSLEVSDPDYIITDVVWFNQEKGQDMTADERFKAASDYEVSIYLETQNGFEFKFNPMGQPVVTASINGSTEDLYVRGNADKPCEIIVKRQFTIPASNRIAEISISGIDAPVAGATPDTQAVCESDLYYIDYSAVAGGVSWYWLDGNDNERLMSAGEKFEAGKKYVVNFELRAANGYKFKVDDPMDPLREVTANIFVNGDKGEALSMGQDTFVLIGYNFGPCHGHELVFNPSKFPSCNGTGNIGYYACSCGDWFWDEAATEPITDKEEIVIPPTGAHVTTLVGAKAATCSAEGYTGDQVCTVCGAVDVKGTAIAKKAHTAVKDAAVAPTYKAAGKTEGSHCKVCGFVIKKQGAVARKSVPQVKGLKTKTVKLASGSKSTLTLTWTKISGVDKYEVQQYVGKKWKTVKTTSKNTNSYTATGLKANKSYKFRVRAVAGEFKGKYSSAFTAKTAPLTSSLTLKAGKKQLTASWTAVANITGYEVQYSTSKSFTKKTTKTVTIKKSKTKKTTIKKLSKGKKYYVKVRAYKTVSGKNIYGAWSKAKYVKVK